MKKRSIIFIVCIILMNSLSGCKIRDKEYLMVCEKNEETTYGEVHRVVELSFVNDVLIEKKILENGSYDTNSHDDVAIEISNDYTKYSKYKNVKYTGSTSNNSNYSKETIIDLRQNEQNVYELFDIDAITKKQKISYTYEYNKLKENGYSCKLENVEVNDTVMVSKLQIIPVEEIGTGGLNEEGVEDIHNGYRIEVTFEPYNVEHWGESDSAILVWHDRNLYKEVYGLGLADDKLLASASIPKKANSSTVIIGTGTEEWLNPPVPIKEEYMITFDELQEYVERLDEVLVTVVYNHKTMKSQKVKVTK